MVPPVRSPINPEREPTVNFTWREFLEANGIITFNGALLPGKTEDFEKFEGPRNGVKSISGNNLWTAQTFTVGNTGTDADFYPTKIWLDCPIGGSVFKIEVQEVTAGEPNGSVLATFNSTGLEISPAASSPGWWEWDIADSDTPNLKLSAATQYALVIYRDSGTTDELGFHSAGSYTGGEKLDSTNSGGAWTVDSGADLLFIIKGSTKNPYILTSVGSITSSKASTVVVAAANATQFTELFNVSFEGKINKSAIIQGDAIVNFTLAKGGDMKAMRGNLELYHVRGATETKIGESEAWTNDTATGVEMELTRTVIKAGDTIKLKFILYYIEASFTTGSTITLSHSGSNLTLQLPFKTDLI